MTTPAASMTPDRVHLDPGDPLDPLLFLCDLCGRLWVSMAAAAACCEEDPR